MKKYIIASLLFVGLVQSTAAQLVINQTVAQGMAEPNFFGNNYSISNVTYTGDKLAKGRFNGTNSSLGLDSGFFLMTGNAFSAYSTGSPLGPNNNASSGIDNYFVGSFLLSNFLGVLSTFNAATLDFDIIPYVDTLGFDFVFASEEYPEYVGQQYTDGVVILISGPGIIGQKNLARIGQSSLTVQVNTINNGSNNTGPCHFCSYYQNNGDGTEAPYNTSDYYIQYDGLTRNLRAYIENLQVGEMYHLTFIVADVSDPIYDSGLFIEGCINCSGYLDIPQNELNTLQLIPNPATNEAKLLGLEDIVDFQKIEISNTLGQHVETLTQKISTLQIAHLPAGMYYVTVFAGDKTERLRLLKN